MTIEVRQLLIKSQVNPAPPPTAPSDGIDLLERERLKEEILAECRNWLAHRLADARER